MTETRMLSRAKAEEIVDGFEGALRKLGAQDPYWIGNVVLDFIYANPEALAAIRSHEAFCSYMQALPDEAEPLLPLMVTVFDLLPTILEGDMRKVADSIIRENPNKTPPGRPFALDDSARRRICEEVLELYGKGVPVSIAQERVAMRQGVSKSTVERSWRQRGRLAQLPPATLRELIVLIEKA